MAQLTEEQKQEIQMAFSLFDKNKDGHVSRAEIIEVMRACGQNPTDAEVKEMIDDVDDNGNGTVEYAEFETMVAKNGFKSREQSEEEMRDAFKVFDRNGDGYITTSELRSTMTSLGNPLSQAELEDMISLADANNDGRVDYNEFAKLMIN